MTPVTVSPSALRVVLLGAFLAFTGRHGLAAGDAEGERRPCSNGFAIVQGAEAADFGDVCGGVAGALAFFAGHGIRPTEPVSIAVTAAIPEEAGPTAAGCYIEQRRRVYVVPYATFRRNKTWFGIPINREIYRTLAAHEAAHAVAACHFRIAKPTIQAKEYIAYVAMFSAMSTELRAQALKATRTEGFERLDRS